MHVHGIAEMAYDPLGAQAAGFLFVGIAPLAVQNLVVMNGHAAAANPVFTVARVNVVEVGHAEVLV
jgi:hypothetical protein